MSSSPAANWYPDPANPALLRYWDGARWTDHTHAPNPKAGPAAPSAEPALPPAPVALTQPASSPAQGTTVPEPPSQARGGLFGSKKGLEAELEDLRGFVAGFGYAERDALRQQVEHLRTDAAAATAQRVQGLAELASLQSQLVQAREELILQEVGVYDYRHRLEDALAYKDRIDHVRERIREMAKSEGGAVTGSAQWQVNGSATEGRKMVKEFSKLLLRAYNGEADVLVNKMRPYKLDAAVDRLDKSRAAIVRLGATMHIAITDEYHRLRIEELRLTADYLARKEEEKEAERAEKDRLREEARARKEFEAEKARLLKEQAHYLTALERIRSTGTPEEVADAEAKLTEIVEAIHGVEEREANVRAGYVYVISNVGAFGEDVVKIGMTRRLDPLDRVRELGDASVPFRHDVHAIVFSDDAVTLENRLHHALEDRRLNLVNARREFFYAAPSEVKALLTAADGSVLEFIEEPEADEWHQSLNARRRMRAAAANQATAPTPH